jgi:hypothetical protein
MLQRHRMQLLKSWGVILIKLVICGLASWYAYCMCRGIKAWLDYDPKEAAIVHTKLYLEAAYAHPTAPQEEAVEEAVVGCGGVLAYDDCWTLLQEVVVQSSNQYTLTVVFYDWEAGVPLGSGDDVIVRVELANTRPVLVYTYEGCVDFCSYEPDDWSPPR